MNLSMDYDVVLLDTGYDIKGDNHNVDIFAEKGASWHPVDYENDDIGHGGAVLSIIKREYTQGRFAVFKVFTSVIESNITRILSALNYIYKNVNCKYLQMSFGVRAYNRDLENICRKLYEERKIIIVAAFDNCGAISYPAAFEFVIGVSGNAFIRTKNEFKVFMNGIVDIQAKSAKQVVASKNSTGKSVEEGNSFATSYVTAVLMRSEKQFPNKLEAMRYICKDYKIIKKENGNAIIGKRLAFFPLNKEMYSLLNYSDDLVGEPIDFYDIKYSSNIGRTIKGINSEKTFIVKNIENIEWDSFDTFVLGHVRELSQILKYEVKGQILEKCLLHNKNVYCFDSFLISEYITKFRQKGLVLQYASIDEATYLEGRLYQIVTPIMCVMGTSKHQGKFTLQMQIKKVLSSAGVNVGVLGTEPSSILLGADEMVPLGYDSGINEKSSERIIQLLNEKLSTIDKKGKDVILTGGQSGFFPQVYFNIGHINASQMSFLYGVRPDGIILTFNIDDDLTYLRKAVCAIEAITGAKVFMFALYAFRNKKDYVIDNLKVKLSDEEVAEKRKMIQREFGVSMVVSGEKSDENLLLKTIINYFCEEANEIN